MLDEHLADGVFGKVRIDGLAAELNEGGEGFAETRVTLVFLFEDFRDCLSEVRDLLAEFEDGFLPVCFVLVGVLEEAIENLDEILGVVMESSKAMRPF
jgi:hypothetical protein